MWQIAVSYECYHSISWLIEEQSMWSRVLCVIIVNIFQCQSHCDLIRLLSHGILIGHITMASTSPYQSWSLSIDITSYGLIGSHTDLQGEEGDWLLHWRICQGRILGRETDFINGFGVSRKWCGFSIFSSSCRKEFLQRLQIQFLNHVYSDRISLWGSWKWYRLLSRIPRADISTDR